MILELLAPRKTGDGRPILNQKPLNKFIRLKRFRLESLASVLACPIEGMRTASLDLSDAYLHGPVASQDQRYLRFKVQDQTYRFDAGHPACPPLPRCYTLGQSGGSVPEARGVNFGCYLDVWLIYGRTPLETTGLVGLIVRTVRDPGFFDQVKSPARSRRSHHYF